MPRGGARAGAGRKPGSATLKTREAANRLAAEGLTPLDYLIGVLRGTQVYHPDKFEAAKAAAPYVHPKLAMVAHTGSDGGAVKVERIERVVIDSANRDTPRLRAIAGGRSI